MRKCSLAWLVVAGLVLMATPVFAQDNLDGPWSTAFGINGTARAPFPVIFPPGGEWEVAWMLESDPNTLPPNGFVPPANATQIVFDAAGNLYWHSMGFWSNEDFVASVTPDGEPRWAGPPETLGYRLSDITPVVGQDAVYQIGMFDPSEFVNEPPCYGFTSGQWVFALSKVDGSVIWRTTLDNEPDCPEPLANNAQPNPALYNGRLYVMGLPEEGSGVALYQIDAATGAILGNNLVPQIEHKMCGNTVLLPDRFGAGIHAMYVLVWDQDPTQVVCLRVNTLTNTASWVWESSPVANGSEVGFLTWYSFAHLMYNEVSDRIYAYTEDNSFGYDFFSFDPLIGDDWKWWGDSGSWWMNKGWYQTGAVDFDGTRMLTGSYDGGFAFYEDDGVGNVQFTESIHHLVWDRPRQFVQLLYDAETESTVAVTASSGMGTGMTHVVMIDLDDRDPPAEDGPMYVDEIEVYQGPDVDHLTLVWSDNFEAYPEGELPPPWESLYGEEQSAPVVVEDPTGEGQGKVLALDPIAPPDPGDPNNLGQGAYHPFAQTTGNVVVTKYKQWMQDTSEVYEVMWGQDPNDYTRGFAYGNDWDSRRCAIEWLGDWDQPNYQVDQRWEDVMYTYDFPAATASVKMADRAAVTYPWTGEWFAPANSAAGFGVTMWHGDISDNWPRVRVNHLQDVRNGWLGVCTLGGPIVGPDGKIYYFESHQTGDWEPPNEHPGWLFALQPKSQCIGDVDGDGDTDLSDLAALLGGYGTSVGDPNYNPNADFDGDGDIDLSDLAHLLGDYGC